MANLPAENAENIDQISKFMQGLLQWFDKHGPNVLMAIIVFSICWWLSGFIAKLALKAMKRSRLDVSMVSFLNSLTRVSLKATAILIFIGLLGVNVSTIVAGLSAVGVTAGLAIKDSLANVASGVLLVLQKPFNIGDYVELKDIQGNVLKIEIMFTTLITPDNKTIIIPNSLISSNYMINYTCRETRRLDLVFSIGYTDNIEDARKVIKEIIEKNDKIVNKDKAIIVVESHMASSINLGVKVWCKNADFLPLKYELQEKVKNSFDKNKISIPYNQLDVHVLNANNKII